MTSMKMVRPLAGILGSVSRFAAVLYLVPAIGILGLLCFPGSATGKNSWALIEEDHFTVFIPFSTSPFFQGDFNQYYLGTTFITMVLYALFLWLLGGVFKAFREWPIFTSRNVTRFRWFYLYNLLVPVACIVFLIIAGKGTGQVLLIALLHCLAGIFTFFMSTIFTQGLRLQEEQDLTL